MMRYFSRIIMLVMAVVMLTGCVESLDKSHYRVECKISPELGTDSVSLMLLMSDYNSVFHVATVARDNASQTFVFEGTIEEPTVAYLKFNNDTTPMIFVVEPGEILIDIVQFAFNIV